MAQKNRILFMAESLTLAHVVRPAQLAETLSPTDYEVHYASAPQYQKTFAPQNATLHPIHCMSGAEFQKRLDQGISVFNQDLLEEQIQEDLALIEKIQPDIVVGDFRNSLSISARLKKIPYLGIANAYWSHFDNHLMPLPEIKALRILGPQFSNFIFELGRETVLPRIFRHQASPINKIRKKYGFTPLKDFKDCYLDADLVGFADAYEVVKPTASFSTPAVCLGPLIGNFNIPLPTWWEKIDSQKPLIYLNFGSTGNPQLIPDIINELTRSPIQVIVGYRPEESGKVQNHASGATVFYGDILPGDLMCQKADVIINNGGSGGGYQALMAGKPLVGISKNMDQMLNMHFMAKESFVHELPNWTCTGKKVAESVAYFLNNELEQQKARKFAQSLKHYQTSTLFTQALQQLQSSTTANTR